MSDIISQAREALAAKHRVYSSGEWRSMVSGLLDYKERIIGELRSEASYESHRRGELERILTQHGIVYDDLPAPPAAPAKDS